MFLYVTDPDLIPRITGSVCTISTVQGWQDVFGVPFFPTHIPN